MLEPESSIPIVKLKSSAAFPFAVHGQQAEAWCLFGTEVTLAAAIEKARALKREHPAMSLRIEHHAGKLLVTEQLPNWKRCSNGLPPYDVPLWSGAGDPPTLGSTITVAINDIGPGLVTGYTVQEGWLAVMFQACEESRPLWHRKENPENRPFLLYGSEILF